MRPRPRLLSYVTLLLAAGCSDLGTPLRPGCEVSATALDFGSVLVGQPVDRTVTIRSVGAVDLPVNVISPCADFQVVAGGGRGSLRPGEQRNVIVRFSPAGLGSSTCTLTLGAGCPTVDLRGQGQNPGLGPVCSVNPTTLDFSTVTVGQFSDRSFTINSVGTADLAVDVVSPCPDLTIVGGGGPGTIAPGGGRVVTVRFAPTASGPYSCTISLGTECSDVVASGEALAPATVFFGADIQPIFSSRCVMCHPGIGPFPLTAGDSYPNLVNVTSVGYPPAVRVKPGDPDASVLYNKVAGTGVNGQRMPLAPNPPLTSAQIAKIRTWILEGARNN